MKEGTFPEEARTVINRPYPTAQQPPVIKQKLQEKHNHLPNSSPAVL